MKAKEKWKYSSRGRGQNAKGRSKQRDRFVKLDEWLQATDAWQALRPTPRALYVELVRRFNSLNNGEISMSVREAAALLHIAKDTASKAFRELDEKGFIRRNVCGSFNWKLRHATTWILTAYDFGEESATKEFARWRPEKTKPGPKQTTDCPNSRTPTHKSKRILAEPVPVLGPIAENFAFHGPKSRHAYSLPCHAASLRLCAGARRCPACSGNTGIIAALIAGSVPIDWLPNPLSLWSLADAW